ncbi:HSP20-like chaperone [Ochromonadaceae sp. CCMP2298]|nr:HSP20-like chaperone [Ochromonadaceae sp. CCMP2298]|mmetsp:Transcript_11084/g.24600  ORF Transcript_11084/g.24600 Transcript_11084/m.24600 type:complete len:189 (+) Transcript_11084:149-715(+)
MLVKIILLALMALLSVQALRVPMYQVRMRSPPMAYARSSSLAPASTASCNPCNPGSTMLELINEFEKCMPSTTASARSMNRGMLMDVKESDTEFLLMFDLPGVAKEDIKIETIDNQLTVSADRKVADKKEGESFRRIERATGMVTRSVTLPENVDVDRIAAQSVDGVLKVTIPKMEKEQNKAKTVTVL